MRSLILVVVATAVAAAAAPAFAERYRSKHEIYADDGYGNWHHTRAERHQRRLINSAEHDRAQNCDPTGQYAAYPDWARSAFTCGRRR